MFAKMLPILVLLGICTVTACDVQSLRNMESAEIYDGCVVKEDAGDLLLLRKTGNQIKFQFGDGPDSVLSAPTSELIRLSDGLLHTAGISDFGIMRWRGENARVLHVEARQYAPEYYYVILVRQNRSALISQLKLDTSRLEKIYSKCK